MSTPLLSAKNCTCLLINSFNRNIWKIVKMSKKKLICYHTVHRNNEKCFDMWLVCIIPKLSRVVVNGSILCTLYTLFDVCVICHVRCGVDGGRNPNHTKKNTSRFDEILGSIHPDPFCHERFGGYILVFVSWGLRSFGNMSDVYPIIWKQDAKKLNNFVLAK